ncbi:hypothetical protein, partial [Sodalis-like endosymbiont of Proechinophthirus fluctus]|uniref:hypothetical protein n=1 Tax=Sodalis-like endosymbiont of Proechinophthirus fluctus TaxID=1462730 RepID=UPI003F754469
MIILGVVGKLHGIEQPHINAYPAHGKHRGAIARMTGIPRGTKLKEHSSSQKIALHISGSQPLREILLLPVEQTVV